MKESKVFLSIIFAAIMSCALFSGIAMAQETASLQVEDASICLDVSNRECIDPKSSFPADIEPVILSHKNNRLYGDHRN